MLLRAHFLFLFEGHESPAGETEVRKFRPRASFFIYDQKITKNPWASDFLDDQKVTKEPSKGRGVSIPLSPLKSPHPKTTNQGGLRSPLLDVPPGDKGRRTRDGKRKVRNGAELPGYRPTYFF